MCIRDSLSTEEYTYTSERLPDGWDGARIVVLTDLHGKQFGTDNVRLLEACLLYTSRCV